MAGIPQNALTTSRCDIYHIGYEFLISSWLREVLVHISSDQLGSGSMERLIQKMVIGYSRWSRDRLSFRIQFFKVPGIAVLIVLEQHIGHVALDVVLAGKKGELPSSK
jgi:hypothetical protein